MGPLLPHLLLVEDSPDDEVMSLRGIANAGIACDVTVRRDGEGAIDLLLGPIDPAPTLIVLDYSLPRLSGLDVLTRLRSNEKTRLIPVVIFSGTNSGTALNECYRSGANSCVQKPDDPREYVDRLARVAHYWLSVNQPSL